jgi:transposase InsO family protein
VRRPAAGLIHHSNRSSQYCSIDYQAELSKHGILISMSGKGNCFDNSMVETFFKTLKSELVWRTCSTPVCKLSMLSPATSTGSRRRFQIRCEKLWRLCRLRVQPHFG